MDESIEVVVQEGLDVPFKEFTAGQVIQSKQFNDDMHDIEDKINEIILKYNIVVNSYKEHIINYLNPHQVTAHQTGAYTVAEVDGYVDDLQAGGFNDNAIVNRVLSDNCVETRNIKDGGITATKVELNFGNQLDISGNIDITSRYTKDETNEIIKSKVGDGTYSKVQIDEKLSQVQAGQIVDNSIGINQLKAEIGKLIDITQNPSILERYTKSEVNELIVKNGLPRDWGSITEKDENEILAEYGAIPVADVMTCDEFRASISTILDIDVAEVVESRSTYSTLPVRLNLIESTLDAIIQMFSEVTINEQ